MVSYRPLSDALSWGAMIDPETILTKSGELMRCIRFIPHHKSTLSPAQLMVARAAQNSVLLSLGSKWSVWILESCRETREYESPDSFPDLISQRIDEIRRDRFSQNGKQYQRSHHLAALYAPPPDALGQITSRFDNPGEEFDDAHHQRHLGIFQDGFDRLRVSFDSLMSGVHTLKDAHLINFLHSRISNNRDELIFPDLPIFLSEYLTDDTFSGGLYPMLGDNHVLILRIKNQPHRLTPKMSEELNRQEFEYDNIMRWQPFDYEDAEKLLISRRDAWANARKKFITKILSSIFRLPDDGTKDNKDAVIKTDLASDALALLASNQVSYGMWSHLVILKNKCTTGCHIHGYRAKCPDVTELNDRAHIVRQVFHGFPIAVVQDGSMSAWLGSIPGHPRSDLGRFLGPSTSFASVMPASAVWTGPERDRHLDGPPLIHCRGEGKAPFRLCLHQEDSDVGNTAVLGELGGGKSTLLKTILVSHRKYRGSRIFYIDKGAVAKLPVLALGGTFNSLESGNRSVSLQPLVDIHIPQELEWANQFVLGMMRQQGLDPLPAQREELTLSLRSIASRPQRERTLTQLRHAIQDKAMKQAIGAFCIGGECGDLLDNDEHRVGSAADVKLFETDKLLRENETAVGPVIACIFHEIAKTYSDNRPTLIVIDECKEFISRALVADALDEVIRRSRRERIQIILATHTMQDIADSKIGHIIGTGFKTWIFTANRAAIEPATARILAERGLSDQQIHQIAHLRPKGEYLVISGNKQAKIDLDLSDFEKAIVCGGSGAESAIVDQIYREGPSETFAERILAYKGFPQLQMAAE